MLWKPLQRQREFEWLFHGWPRQLSDLSGPWSTLQARIAECPHFPAFCTLELLNPASETPGWDGGIWSPSPSAALTHVHLLPTASWCDEQPGRGHQWVSWLVNVLRPPLPVMPSLALFQGKAELGSGQQLGSACSSASWAWLLSSQHLPLESGEEWLNEWTAVGTGWACSLAVALLSGLGLALLERFSEGDTEAQSRGGVCGVTLARPRWAPRPLVSVLTSLCSFFFF